MAHQAPDARLDHGARKGRRDPIWEALRHVHDRGQDVLGGACQTDWNEAQEGQDGCPLCRAELAPLCESSGSVSLEDVST